VASFDPERSSLGHNGSGLWDSGAGALRTRAGEAGLSLQDSSPGPPREYPAAATLQRSLDESGAAGSGGGGGEMAPREGEPHARVLLRWRASVAVSLEGREGRGFVAKAAWDVRPEGAGGPAAAGGGAAEAGGVALQEVQLEGGVAVLKGPGPPVSPPPPPLVPSGHAASLTPY
jgi:hypothetical protein